MDEVSIEAAGEALPLADEILFFPCLVVWSVEIRVVHRTLSSRWKNCRPLFMIHPSTVAARSLPRSGRNFIRRTSELAAVRALDDGRRVAASVRPSVRHSSSPVAPRSALRLAERGGKRQRFAPASRSAPGGCCGLRRTRPPAVRLRRSDGCPRFPDL